MDIKEALQELAQMIKVEVLARMTSSVGVNPRTGTNTLEGSDLYKSVDVKPVSDNEIVFQIAAHYRFVVLGWKRTGNFGGGLGAFLKGLLQWMRKKGVHSPKHTDNQLAWAILKSIWNRNIQARPFINYDEGGDVSKILPFLDEFFEKWADNVFDDMCHELDEYFDAA